MEAREKYSRLLRRADRLGNSLADSTESALESVLAKPDQLRLVQFVFGLRAWRIVRAARRLLRLKADDPVGILARHMFELRVGAEYISTETIRTSKKHSIRLSPGQKTALFLEYYWIEMERSGYEKPPAKALAGAKRRRSRLLIKGDRYWHGASTLELCRELDRAKPMSRPKLREENYDSVFRTLSAMFVHPSFRSTPWLDFDVKGERKVRWEWELNELYSLILLYGVETMKPWNDVLGGPKKRMVTRLLGDAIAVLKES